MAVLILVGSETGNSLDYATRASDDFFRLGIKAQVHFMDEFDLERLFAEEEEEDIQLLLFICSTTGDGEEPQNMRNFIKFLRRSNLPSSLFSSFYFAVFGLGDSSYEKFNFVGKRVYRRIQQLGGRDLVGFRGEGDERSLNRIEGGWITWWEALLSCMNAKGMLITDNRTYSDLEPLPPSCVVNLDDDDHHVDNTRYTPLKVIQCVRVTPEDHFQDTRLLTLEPNEMPEFIPGDILGLKPENNSEVVEQFLNLMKWNGSVTVFGIKGNFLGNWSATANDSGYPMSLKEFIKRFVDLTRIPGKSVLKTLACLCNLEAAEYSQAHQDKLLELSRDEGEYLDYVWRPKRTMMEIIADFQPTLKKIDLSRLLQLFPPIKARQFSVANDAAGKGGRFELLVGLVKEELPRGMREGLCSQWIRNGIETGDWVSGTLSRGSINYKQLIKSSKVFLFAAGTGIAPLRSIIQRLSSTNVPIYLYFGYRMKQSDFYFAEEWAGYNNLTVFSAGSRDGSGTKVYLDDLIKMNPEPLIQLDSLEQVSFVVTGHSRLPKLVLQALKEVWTDKPLWTYSLKGGNDRFQTETWS